MSAQVVTQACEQALLADLLLTNSGEFLKLVVELGDAVNGAAYSLQAAIAASHQTKGDSAAYTEPAHVRMHRATIDQAKEVVELSVETALRIRRIIGWNEHPYFPEQRDGGATLVGIERALAKLSTEANALASSCVHENFFYEIHQRMEVMVLAAKRNTRVATANAVAIETVGAMAIRISRTNQ